MVRLVYLLPLQTNRKPKQLYRHTYQVCSDPQKRTLVDKRYRFLHIGFPYCRPTNSVKVLKVKVKKIKLPMVSIVADTDYTTSGCGAHLRSHGLEPAAGLQPTLWMVDHTTSTTCHYLPGFTPVPSYTAW